MNLRSSIPAAALLAALVLAPASAPAFPQEPSRASGGAGISVNTVPRPLVGIEIVDKRGTFLAKDLRFRDQDGREVTIGSYLDGRPLLVVMAYYECPMLCTVTLNGLNAGLRDLAWKPGKEFRVLTVSFDTKRDTPGAAKAKRDAYLKAYGRPVDQRGWDFLVGDEENVVALAKAIGFGYRWDEKTEQFAHAAGAFVFTPEGRLSNTLLGIQFPERDLRLALTEASQGKLGSAWDRVMLLCYHYDPNEHSYVLAGKQFMKAGGTLSALALGAFLARLWRRELRKPQDPPPPDVA